MNTRGPRDRPYRIKTRLSFCSIGDSAASLVTFVWRRPVTAWCMAVQNSLSQCAWTTACSPTWTRLCHWRHCINLTTWRQFEPSLATRMLPQVACFDTSFHRTQPPIAQQFALPRKLTAEGIRRYGFHGLSYEYIASRLRQVDPRAAAGRTVVAHLGNGASLCALHDGVSVATTMSFTPLDGLPMGSRCGAIDPGVLIYLIDRHGLDARALEHLLTNESGLLGVSGISSDMRTLLEKESIDPRAAEAIELFVYRISRELGSMGRRSAVSMRWFSPVVLVSMLRRSVLAFATPRVGWASTSTPTYNEQGGPRISQLDKSRIRMGNSDKRRVNDRRTHQAFVKGKAIVRELRPNSSEANGVRVNSELA